MLKNVVDSFKKAILLVIFEVVDFLVWFGSIILFPFEVVFLLPSRLKKIKTKSYWLSLLTKALPPKHSKKNKRNKKSRKNSKIKVSGHLKIIKNVYIFTSGALFTLLFLWFPIEVYSWYRTLPKPDLLSETQNRSSKILDRKGRLLYEIYVDKQYNPVSLEDIPDYAVKATLAVEDDAFYSHNGVRPLSMLRAAKAIVFEDNLQGGSTITQQLVKNMLLTSERTVSRKLKEVVIAYRTEREFTKEEILELYFNNIPYGGTAWGIQSASHKFFGKDVKDLTLAEASYLSILPSAPTRYSPFEGDTELASKRHHMVLDRMVSLGYISEEESQQAKSEELAFAPQISYIRAPHFVNYVREKLVAVYGERLVDFGGLTVTTTLDLDLQDKVQQIVAEEVEKNAYLNLSNGAAVVLDVNNGGILAHVGSVDYFDEENDGAFDVVTAFRSPGSTIKPVTYALAFSKGMTPATIVNDSPISIQSYDQVYTPVNYDGKFHGKVTLRQALANSYNIPAVKLAKALGPDEIVSLGSSMGLSNWEVDNSYGLSVTLGGKEVRLIDLTNVYATIAKGGVKRDTTPFLSIKDANGYEIYKDDRSASRAISSGVAYIVTHILSDTRARLPAFGVNNSLTIPGHEVAVKTGTSDEKRDNLTIGFTPSYVVGVWVGNNDYSPMNQSLASGLTGAAPIWNRVMSTVLENKTAENFEKPQNVFVMVDSSCNNRSEVFIKGTEPKNLCTKTKKDNEDKQSGLKNSSQARGGVIRE